MCICVGQRDSSFLFTFFHFFSLALLCCCFSLSLTLALLFCPKTSESIIPIPSLFPSFFPVVFPLAHSWHDCVLLFSIFSTSYSFTYYSGFLCLTFSLSHSTQSFLSSLRLLVSFTFTVPFISWTATWSNQVATIKCFAWKDVLTLLVKLSVQNKTMCSRTYLVL